MAKERNVYLVVDASGAPVAAYSHKRDALSVVSPASLVTLPLVTTHREAKVAPERMPLPLTIVEEAEARATFGGFMRRVFGRRA